MRHSKSVSVHFMTTSDMELGGEAARSSSSSSPAGCSRFGARPKRPSGVRDFPPGCGRQPLPAALRPGPARGAAVRRFPGKAGIVVPARDQVEDGDFEDDHRRGRARQRISFGATRDVTPGRPTATRHPTLINPRENQALRATTTSSEKMMMMRTKVKETLKLFRDTCKQLQRDKRQSWSSSFQATTSNHHQHLLSPRGEGSSTSNDTFRRVDLRASKLLKAEGKYINTGKTIGPVPGVEKGDKFQYRVELNIVGVHHRLQNGIDYFREQATGVLLATSVVSSGEYDRVDGSSGNLIYMGEGGRVSSGRGGGGFKDQRLERGNLALRNSIGAQNPVRVIRRTGFEGGLYYEYDGLYVVRRYWQKRGSHGKLVFMFELARKSDD